MKALLLLFVITCAAFGQCGPYGKLVFNPLASGSNKIQCTGIDQQSGGGVPSGSIIMITSGSCSAGYAEAAELAGLTVIGTTSANMDVGTLGGSDTIVPAGTVSQPTFLGSVLSGHSHTFTGSALSTHSHGVGTIAAAASIFTGTALAGHTHSVTPTGTVAAPTFTGSASSIVQPYIAVYMWKRTA